MKSKSEPVLHEPLHFPSVSTELYFDIETDPTQDFVYLHGFWVRDAAGQRFVEFTARSITPEDERRVWAEALNFMRSFDPDDMALYYYSSFEKSTYRRRGRSRRFRLRFGRFSD